MKKILLTSALVALLAGCASGDPVVRSNQFTHLSGGQSMGDATSFYWYTRKLGNPYTAADYVTSGDYGFYYTDYRWQNGILRELIREGERLKMPVGSEDNELVPYRIHIRYSNTGEAVYQQYRLDGKVLPLKGDQIERLQKEASFVIETVERQKESGQELIQGYWDGDTFETCSEEDYQTLEFNQTLPSFVVNRLATVDSYIAFLGKKEPQATLSVSELLMLAEDSYDCVKRPAFIEE